MGFRVIEVGMLKQKSLGKIQTGKYPFVIIAICDSEIDSLVLYLLRMSTHTHTHNYLFYNFPALHPTQIRKRSERIHDFREPS